MTDGINPCPSCGKEMKKVGEDHNHCDCGVCVYRGTRYTWFNGKEVEYCPEEWRDPYIKTSGLA